MKNAKHRIYVSIEEWIGDDFTRIWSFEEVIETEFDGLKQALLDFMSRCSLKSSH
jgi:hypothetical protein